MRLLLEAFGLRGWVTDIELTAPGHRPVWPDLADVGNRLALQIEGPHHDGIVDVIDDLIGFGHYAGTPANAILVMENTARAAPATQ